MSVTAQRGVRDLCDQNKHSPQFSQFSPLPALRPKPKAHVTTQDLLNRLPLSLLLTWAALLFLTPTTYPVFLPDATINAILLLMEQAALTYNISFCGHLACRHCLRKFKAVNLTPDLRALYSFIINTVYHIKNDGADACHRTIHNLTLSPQLHRPTGQEVTFALFSHNCPNPFFFTSTTPATTTLCQHQNGGGNMGSRENPRSPQNWPNQTSLDQVCKHRRGTILATLQDQQIPLPRPHHSLFRDPQAPYSDPSYPLYYTPPSTTRRLNTSPSDTHSPADSTSTVPVSPTSSPEEIQPYKRAKPQKTFEQQQRQQHQPPQKQQQQQPLDLSTTEEDEDSYDDIEWPEATVPDLDSYDH